MAASCSSLFPIPLLNSSRPLALDRSAGSSSANESRPSGAFLFYQSRWYATDTVSCEVKALHFSMNAMAIPKQWAHLVLSYQMKSEVHPFLKLNEQGIDTSILCMGRVETRLLFPCGAMMNQYKAPGRLRRGH